jgi:predicted Zn-dependent protease
MTVAASSLGTHADPQAAVDIALQTLKQLGSAGVASMGEREEWSAAVRLGAIETVQSAVTRSLRITAIGAGNRSATCSTSDVDPASVRATAAKAAELSAYSDPDEWAGLPPSDECGMAGGDLQLDDPFYQQLDRDRFVATVVEAERIALASDARISNSHRSSAGAARRAQRVCDHRRHHGAFERYAVRLCSHGHRRAGRRKAAGLLAHLGAAFRGFAYGGCSWW